MIGRSGEIRTRDPLHPMQVRYQAAPRSDRKKMIDDVKSACAPEDMPQRRRILRISSSSVRT